MKYLYIDNFRGFAETRIPILDVNFLVGQNSTGKTSVLGLLKLMSTPRFFFSQAFGDDQFSFGNFSDMVSIHSADQSYFRIGLVWDQQAKRKTDTSANGFLMTFVEHQGLPRLATYTFFGGKGDTVSLRFSGNRVLYKSEKGNIPPVFTAKDMVFGLLPSWIEEHKGDNGDYNKLETPRGFPEGRIPLLLAMSLVSEVSEKSRIENKNSFEVHLPDVPFSPEIAWVAPIRTKPKRTYDELMLQFSPEGSHTPYLIRRMLHTKTAAAKFREIVERVGVASGLFEGVRIRSFGRGATAPFEVDIVLDGKALNLSTVGYGVSQSLPVLVEVLARHKGSWFAIQQPEVHLHPRAQAALGDLFFEMAVTEQKYFLIETHSDFTIDRFRMNYRTKRSSKPDSQVLYFERVNKQNTVSPLPIGSSGELSANQPEGYRNFFIKEELRLLEI
ncbi:MAG TPA: AAA family ATPase [Terriglobales bacterium]|nr:AAA family ATPase [Terriglobales bacterium]